MLSLSQQLVSLINSKTIDDVDRDRAWQHLIDWLACASIGATTPQAKAFKQSLNQSARGNAIALFIGHFDWYSAALFNGSLGNILEMDDIHRSSILHPGPVVIPAALAAAQQTNATMVNLLNSIVLGYEVAIRVGQSIGRSHYQYFHNTATCAGFGATVSVAYLLNCDDKQMVSAMGNLGSRTGGLWQMRHENVMTKQWHNADAAMTALLCAQLAHSGVTGVASIFEGQQGIFNALTKDAVPNALTNEHAHWLLHDTSFKPWPACRHAHPAIDAFIEAKSQLPSDYQLTQITVETYQDAVTFCHRPSPTTSTEAKFSIQHAIAAIENWGEPKLSHYDQDVLQDAALIATRDKVKVLVNAEIERRYPDHYGASVTLEYRTSTSAEQIKVSLTDTLGDPERPLTQQALHHKIRYLMTQADVPATRIDDILAFKFDHETLVNQFCRLLAPE